MSKLKAAWLWLRGEILTYPMWLPAAMAAVLAQGTILGWWTLDPTQTGEVTAAVTAVLGLAAAFLTANVGVTVIVTALQAIGSLCIGFTFNGSDKVALYIGALVAFLGFLGHTQNSPNYGPKGIKSAVAAGIRYNDATTGVLPAAVPAKRSHKKKAAVPPEHSVS
jgi:hypothetical protein